MNNVNKLIRAFVVFAVASNGFLFAFAPTEADAAVQNNYRWRNDDGSETTATAAAAQNTTLSIEQDEAKRLRFGVNATANEQDLEETATLTSEDFSSGGIVSGVIDEVNGYAYYGTQDAPAQILKVQLSTMRVVDKLELAVGEDDTTSAIIDTYNQLAYFTTDTIPGKIVKIDLATFTRVDALTFDAGEDHAAGAVIDLLTQFAYVGTYDDGGPSTGIIVKVYLPTMIRITSLTLNAGEDAPSVGVIDTDADKAYFGVGGSPAKIVRIDVDSFTRDLALPLDPSEQTVSAGVIDIVGGFAYFAGVGPYVAKVNLSNFTRTSGIVLSEGNFVNGAEIDVADGQAYFTVSVSGGGSAGHVVRVALSTFTETGTVEFDTAQDSPTIPLVDGANNALYVAHLMSTAELSRISTASFTQTANTVFDMTSISGYRASVVDADAGFGYFGGSGTNGYVAKIRLADFVEVDRLDLGVGIGGPSAAVIDTSGPTDYAYFGADSDVVKVDLSDFSVADTIALSGGGYIASAVIDTEDDFAYFGVDLDPAPGKIYKIDLDTFTEVSEIVLNGDELVASTGVIEASEATHYAYFATSNYDSNPAKIVKINLDSFTRTATEVLDTGESNSITSTIDTVNQIAYFATSTIPSIIVKIDVDPLNFDRLEAQPLDSGEDDARGMVIDEVAQKLYVGTSASPATIVEIDLSTFDRTVGLTLGVDYVSTGIIDPDNGAAYFGTDNSPGEIVKIHLPSGRSYRLEFGTKISTCSAISSWTQVGPTAGTQTWLMSLTSGYTDGAASTDASGVLTNGNSNFYPGFLMDTNSQTPLIAMVQSNEFTEIEYSIKPRSSAALGNYCFRLTDAGAPLESYTAYAEATVTAVPGGSEDNTLNNRILMSRLKQGVNSDVSISFDLQNTLTGTLTVTFPSGFTIVSVTGAGSSGCLSGFDFDGLEVTAEKDGCSGSIVLSGITVTNPSSPGVYDITWINDDPGEGGVAIVDDDQVSVTAAVDASITFDIDTAVADTDTDAPYSVPLGAVSAGSVRVSGATDSVSSIWLELSSNSTGGAVVTVRNVNGTSGLVSVSVPADAIANAAGAMSAGTEKYGLCVAAVTAGVGTFSKAGDYATGTCAANSETNDVENLSTGAASIVSAAAPVSAAQAQVLVQATVSSTTEAHNDYADTLTFVATGTF